MVAIVLGQAVQSTVKKEAKELSEKNVLPHLSTNSTDNNNKTTKCLEAKMILV